MSAAGAADTASPPVTVMVARRVRPGKEIEFEDWAECLTRAASSFDGFLGAGLLRPSHVGEDWHVVYRFATADALARWEHSPVRAKLLAQGERVMSTASVHHVSGLETWFALPGRTAPAPPRWKMFVVSATVIMALQLLLNLVQHGVAPDLWLVPRVVVISVTVTALMTWVVQPWVARLLEGWLYGPR
ncbi:antibiotic biosynthesis monooxygenase [Mycolicibacterium sp.]|uniref:antibiotic biosynthesis monooxygenase n=1 Tax=Mycolicibacterium sp. TaxID=2320850 RepID=UPI0037CB9251